MSAKVRTIFACAGCDAQYPRWLGRCTQCGAWGTLAATQLAAPPKTAGTPGQVVSFAAVTGDNVARYPTGLNEFDRVVGGGIAKSSVTLLGGEPGIGKSTLVLQVADRIASASGTPVLYIAGEESAGQIKDRMVRLKLSPAHFSYLGDSEVQTIGATIRERKPALAIVDSIHTVRSALLAAEPGSLTQVKASTAALVEAAKTTTTSIILIGHITKTGAVAGPKTLEHLVDTVLYLESDESNSYRLLRPVKNRFGSTNELGVFAMDGEGLREVANPSAMFLAGRSGRQAGAVVAPVIIGARAFVAEVQVLVAWSRFGYPQRNAVGFDVKRLNLIATVLDQRVGVRISKSDIHLKIAGGLRLSDPGADLAVALAIVSAQRKRAVEQRICACGEVGLGGEIRPIPQLEQRVMEATKLGFATVMVPQSGTATLPPACLPVATVQDAIRELWGG